MKNLPDVHRFSRYFTTASLFIMIWFLASIFTTPAWGQEKSQPSIHLIALNTLASRSQDPSTIVQSLPIGDFQDTLTSVFSAIQNSLLPKLGRQSLSPSLDVELRTVGVGVGLTGSVGLGPIFQISINPKLVLVFSNSKTPVYPD